MSWRPPSIDTAHDKEVARLERLLAEFEAIPAHRREDELADVRAQSVRALLADLKERKPRVQPLLYDDKH